VNTISEIVTVQQQSTGSGQSNVLFPIDNAIPEAIQCFQNGQFNYIRLTIDQKKERILLDEACEVNIEDLPSKVPISDCAFHFYKWNHTHNNQTLDSTIFIFSTPYGSNGTKPAPVKSRMLYASSRHHVLTSSGLNIDLRLEIGDGKELTENEFTMTLHPSVSEEKTTFKKPTPKGRKPGGK